MTNTGVTELEDIAPMTTADSGVPAGDELVEVWARCLDSLGGSLPSQNLAFIRLSSPSVTPDLPLGHAQRVLDVPLRPSPSTWSSTACVHRVP